MKLSQLLNSVATPTQEEEILGISCDSRNIGHDMLFVALSQDREIRHSHIQEALSRGAKKVFCPTEDEAFFGAQGIYSTNPRYDYGIISGNWFGNPGKQLKIIGITGTNGKTSTTHIIKEMLEGLADGIPRKVGLIGTNGNKIGKTTLPAQRTTPDAYELQGLLAEMVQEQCTHVVMEVSSHGLVQHRTAGLQFTVGIFTNLTQDHLDYHHSMAEYQKAKEQLFHQSHISVLNMDDDAGRAYGKILDDLSLPYLSYSENKTDATIHSEEIHLGSQYVSFQCVEGNRKIPVYLPIPGGFSLYNALASLTCGVALGLPLLKLAQTFPKISGVKGRVEVLPTPSDFTVIIDYAHTPNALENILLTARNITQGRLICLFGCGGNRDKSKRGLMGEIAEDLADMVVISSDNPRFEEPEDIIADILQGMKKNKEITIIPNRKKGIFHALSQGKSGDVVVLAGKGHECYEEIRGEKFHLDEREIVQEFFHIDFIKD